MNLKSEHEVSQGRITFAMNRDTCINMARALDATVADGQKKPFAMISSAKPPPFMPAYLATK